MITTFRPIYGAYGGPVCSLLTLSSESGEMRILLDCGWDASMPQSALRALEAEAKKANIVLLSYGDFAHIGALPYVVRFLSPKAFVFSTFPTAKMGQMALYDALLSREDEGAIYTLDAVDAAVERIKPLKYEERLQLRFEAKDPKETIVSPRPAGRLLGGAIWHVRYDVEEIVYASCFGWNKSVVVDGASSSLLPLKQPSMLITDATAAPTSSIDAMAETKKIVLSTLRRHGNVLIPVDASGRCLELLYSLNRLWDQQRLDGNYKLCFLSPVSRNTVDFAQCLVEWMGRDLASAFEMNTKNPFSLGSVHLLQSADQLEALSERHFPLCVLATDQAMQHGASRELLRKWAGDPLSTILLTQQDAGPEAEGPAAKAEDGAAEGEEKVVASPLQQLLRITAQSAAPQIQLQVPVRVRRSEEEVKGARAQLEQRRRARQEALEQQRRVEKLAQEMNLLEESDDEEEKEGGRTDGRKRRLQLVDRYAKRRFPVFDVPERQRTDTPYGQPLSAEEMKRFRRHTRERSGEKEFRDMQMRRRQGQLGMAEAGERVAPGASDEDSEEEDATGAEDAQLEAQIEWKTVLRPENVQVSCRVARVDWSGYTDSRSREFLLEQMQPKRLVLFNSRKPDMKHLVGRILRRLKLHRDKIAAPDNGREVSFALDTPAFDVTVEADVAKSLRYVSIPESSTVVAALAGDLSVDPAGKRVIRTGKGRAAAAGDTCFLLAKKPDVTALKRRLDAANIPSELRFSKDRSASMLVCEGMVAVRLAHDSGDITVEGPLCALYYQVRKAIYDTGVQINF